MTGGSSTNGVYVNSNPVALQGTLSPVAGRNWSTLSSTELDLNNAGDHVFSGSLEGDASSNQLLVNLLEVMPVGDATGVPLVRLAGLGIAISDVAYRRAQSLSVMSLEASTIFFVIPSWLVGLVLLVFAGPLLEG